MNPKALTGLLSHRVVGGLGLLGTMLVTATAGYMLIEGWSFLDALYMSVTAITTVGFREIHPLSTTGQVFTIFVVLLGVGSAFYILTAMVAAISEGDFRQVLDVRRMRLAVQELRDHYIVCGYGRVGEEVVRELAERKAPFVVVDTSEAVTDRARASGLHSVQGDATVEETLIEAGIARCNGVFAATDSDSINTYITLTAKSLNPQAFVVARLRSPSVESKLRQAGADRVISPYSMGGRRMALSALQPYVTDFVELFANDPTGERVLVEITVEEGSEFAGRNLGEILARTEDVVVLAVRDVEGALTVGPPRSRVLQSGEIIIVIGSEADVRNIGSARRAVHASAARGSQSPVASALRRVFRRRAG